MFSLVLLRIFFNIYINHYENESIRFNFTPLLSLYQLHYQE
ncbi:hypothetical protein pb186bvf_008158 [Paramecium bursaria]